MTEAFEVCSFTGPNLIGLFARHSKSPAEQVGVKSHAAYFVGYLTELGITTIVVEHDYTDTFYLADYVGYYARCFSEYGRRCTRLHFFDFAFDENSLEALLSGTGKGLSKELLRKGYKGFLVVKPLPVTFIGRTCLATYPNDESRHYSVTRTYHVNLFGIPLEVESLAFQEQDTVAARCATSALWALFNGTGSFFHHAIPSPLDITKAATSVSPGSNRILPNTGLSEIQVAQAIRHVGLEPFSIEVRDNFVTKATLYAYLNGKVPVLMFGAGFDEKDLSRDVESDKMTAPQVEQNHAVTATGFRLGRDVHPYGAGFLLRASRIDQIYAHDDQVGPFAKMIFEEGRLRFPDNAESGYLSTPYAKGENLLADIFVPFMLMAPLTTTIRIPFELVLDAVIDFDSFVEILREAGQLQHQERIEWDIYLTSINNLKSDLFKDNEIPSSSRLQVLTSSLPRFVWRATGRSGASKLIDLLFDSTDLEQGNPVLRALSYDDKWFASLIRAAI